MAVQSLIEGKLCKLWARAKQSGEWFDMFQELSDIADVMFACGTKDGYVLFTEAATMALDRSIYDMRMKEAA